MCDVISQNELYIVWYTDNIVTASLFNDVSIDDGAVAVVDLFGKLYLPLHNECRSRWDWSFILYACYM